MSEKRGISPFQHAADLADDEQSSIDAARDTPFATRMRPFDLRQYFLETTIGMDTAIYRDGNKLFMLSAQPADR